MINYLRKQKQSRELALLERKQKLLRDYQQDLAHYTFLRDKAKGDERAQYDTLIDVMLKTVTFLTKRLEAK